MSAFTNAISASLMVLRRAGLFSIAIFALFVYLTPIAQAQSALDGFDPNANGLVRLIVVQPDGKIIIGGGFTTILGVVRNRIARLNPDGTLDTTFNPNADNTLYSIVVQPDGKILIGGYFTTLAPNNGAPVDRINIARLNADGTLDMGFDPNPQNSGVFAITVQSDGKILIVGFFTTVGGVARNFIARVNADGTLDTAFDPNSNAFSIATVAVQSDGKILIGGTFTTLAPNGGAAVTRNRIARLERDGLLDQTLNLSAVGNYVLATAIQPDGKIIIGGKFTSVLGTTRSIARLNTDGTLDAGFNTIVNNNSVLSIAVQPDGKILVGGDFITIGGVTRNRIARVNADGMLDTAFVPNAGSTVFSIALQSDGKILVGGDFTTIGGQSRRLFARLSNDTAALSTLTVTTSTVTMTRNGSAAQFNRVIFEQSIDNGATYTFLGTATNSFAPLAIAKGDNQFAPLASGYTLTGLSLPIGQNILIRARGFYRAGNHSSSDIIEDKVQNAFLAAPTAANVLISGRVITPRVFGLVNAFVTLTDSNGISRTVITGRAGSFRFTEVAAGETYIISVRSKRYTYAPQVVTVNEDLTGLTFTPQ
ncbi:MAG: delta-60 repeat domain-containing protein [Pyrinomonadaceae bacterium]